MLVLLVQYVLKPCLCVIQYHTEVNGVMA